MNDKLKSSLPEKRYKHSVGVAKEAVRLARLYGGDEDKAYIAGLLHDCAKGYTTERQIEMCAERGIKLDEQTLLCPPVVHGFLGADMARTEYGVADEEILEAIKYHTIGKAGMNLLEKIIYIADMTEVNRDFDGVEVLRSAVEESLDKAIMISVEQQLALQCERKSTIHPNIICMWNDLISDKSKK